MSSHTSDQPSRRPQQGLAFYASVPHDCGYLPDHSAVSVFADPNAPMDMATYSALAEMGFRRSGAHVYAPHCPHCKACIAARVPVDTFQANRTQRRTFNGSLTATIMEPALCDEQFALYQKYIATRHAGGGMDDPSPEKYLDFLNCDWSHTEFVEFRLGSQLNNQLVAVAVTDVLSRGLSCVYTFFDPDFAHLSPGRYALLWQIGETQRRNLPWLFIGYWISNCQKMFYKQEYRPIELFLDGHWQCFDRQQSLPSS